MPLYLAIVLTSLKSGFEACLAAFLTTIFELDINVRKYIEDQIELQVYISKAIIFIVKLLAASPRASDTWFDE